MDRIKSMGVFAKVVAKQSFSGAARELRLSQAVVSKHVRALEDWLGAQLLNHTTRRLNLTEIGALVYERCERSLDEIDEVQQSTSALQTAPRGVLHLATPISFGITQLGPALADYLSRYPEVVVDATFDDRFIVSCGRSGRIAPCSRARHNHSSSVDASRRSQQRIYLGVAEQIAGADDHDPHLAEHADQDCDALPAQSYRRRFAAMHRCRVRKSTQIEQPTQGQNRPHRLCSGSA